MRHDILGLQAFVTIAERGSFRAAASHLNLSQTALSHRIRKLEESLGTELLIRTTRQVTLSPAGLALLPTANRLFEELDSTLSDVRSASRLTQSRISLACLPTAAIRCLPAAVEAFAGEYPEVQLRIFDTSAREIANRVQNGDAEFGLTILAANRWDFEARPLVREPFVLLVHRNHPLAGMPSLAWSQLDGLALVQISTEAGNRILIDDALGGRQESLQWRFEVQRLSTAISLVIANVGCAIVPRMAIDLDHNRELAAIPLRTPGIFRTLGIVSKKGSALSAPAKRLIHHISEVLKRQMPQDHTPDIDE